MLYSNVQDTRKLFYTSWKKYRLNEPLIALEQQLVDIIIAHPEYQNLFQNEHADRNEVFFPELGQSNPFLHMGLHLAVREQISTNRPNGITSLFQKLLQKSQHSMLAEHQVMDCLAERLWYAQKNNQAPNEEDYLNAIKRLLAG